MNPQLKAVQIAVGLLILLFGVIGCGNKGKLYLPPAEDNAQQTVETSIESAGDRSVHTPEKAMKAD